jgi:hypothetical protein
MDKLIFTDPNKEIYPNLDVQNIIIDEIIYELITNKVLIKEVEQIILTDEQMDDLNY